MNCEQIKYQLVDYIDNNLDQMTMENITNHLKKCDNCQDEHLQTGALLKNISADNWDEPSIKLKTNFYQMLEAEKTNLHVKPHKTKLNQRTYFIPLIKTAAQIIILIALAAIVASSIYSREHYKKQTESLHTEISNLKNTASLVALSEPSASERLQAINSVNQQSFSNEIFEALINTMNNDENVNVRMSAMYALSKYSNHEMVKTAFVESIKYQSDPLLQITLINILVNIQDARAKEPIQNILDNKETPDVVKQQAKTSLQAFI